METMDTECVALLADLASALADCGLVSEVDVITAGLLAARPDREGSHLLRALARLNAGDIAGAEVVLRKDAMPLAPESPDVKAVLGLTLMMAGRHSERDRVLAPLASPGDDAAVAVLATELMQQTP